MVNKNVLMVMALLSACGGADGPARTSDGPSDGGSVEASQAAASRTASAELGSWGVETDDMDPSVEPGEDFFQFVGGRWMDSFEMPSDYSSYGSFTVLRDRSEERVRAIIEDAAKESSDPTTPAGKVGAYFAAFMDTDAINAKGLTPLAGDLAKIDAAGTHGDIAALFSDPALGAASPIGISITVDAKSPDNYAVYMGQSGLGMPNKTYYLDAKFADKRTAYKAHIEKMLTLAGFENAKERAGTIYALEEKIAMAHWEPEKRRNRDLTYNPVAVSALSEKAPGLDWAMMLKARDIDGIDQVIMREDSAIAELASLVSQTPVDQWKDYLRFHLIDGASSVLPSEFDDANFDFYGRELRGTPEQRDRWKRGVAAVNRALGEAVGQIYVQRHFPAQSKEKMDELVANLRAAMENRLETLDWMGVETRAEAVQKLTKFTPKIGFPEKWTDYSALTVSADDPYANQKSASVWNWEDARSKLGGPVDETEWGMTPQTVNAYYSPTRNEIVFPAAILQPPFFDPFADDAVNYGAIGAVIGHEIGHGFDDQGRKSDGDGVLRDWWTAQDAENFEALASRLGGQYASYEPIPGFAVRPGLTMGENIGDLGGLAMAYHAYKLSLNGAEAPVIDGFTGDQRFFMAWAQVWKRVVREEALKNQIETDPHSPARYRVNGIVRNMDAWYAAFDVTEDDALYLPPEERVQIW